MQDFPWFLRWWRKRFRSRLQANQSLSTFCRVQLMSQVMLTKLILSDSFCRFKLSYQGFAWSECTAACRLHCNCFWFWESYRFSKLRFWLLQKYNPFSRTGIQYSRILRIFSRSLSFLKWEKMDFSWKQCAVQWVDGETWARCILKLTLLKVIAWGWDCTRRSWYRSSNRAEVPHRLWGLR